MSKVFTGGVDAVSGLLGIGGSLASAFRDEPSLSDRGIFPPFRGGITTPGFSFSGGQLSRTGSDAFSFPGFATSLQGVSSGLAGVRGGIGDIRSRIAGAQGQAAGLFGQTQGLRGRITGLDSDLSGLQGRVTPGFGELSKATSDVFSQRGAEAVGNLRAQQQDRNITGSSFANAALATTQRQFAIDENLALSQAKVAEIEQTRAIVQDRAGLVELSGQLITLDQASLAEQSRLIALDLGASETEIATFQAETLAIQVEMQAFRDQIDRELRELGIATQFLAQVDQFLNDQGSQQIQAAAGSISGGNFSQEKSGDREASDAVSDDRDDPTTGDRGGFGDARGGNDTGTSF